MAVPHEILIIGGNIGGVSAAHYLLRKTIPELERVDDTKAFHVTLVTPNTHLLYKIAAPRALINPTLIPESEILKPLSEAFEKYDASRLLLVQGIATAIDPAERSVTVSSALAKPVTDAPAPQKIHYDSLIIATGTTSSSALWSLHPDQSLTTEALHLMHKVLPTIKTVLVAGGGPVGVETAGEIASAYPECQITLLSGSARVLPKLKPAISARAQAYLEKTSHVEVIHDVRVVDSKSAEKKSTIVTLTDGSTKTVDLYIDATGGVPNSQFLPTSWLDESGRVITADDFFRVRGSTTSSGDAKGVYVLGDIVAGSANTLIELDFMVPVVGSSLAVDIVGGAPKPTFLQGLWYMVFRQVNTLPIQKEFKPLKNTMLVSIGTGGGVGWIMGWGVPSWFVALMKCKSFLLDLFPPIVSGKKWT